MTVLCGIWHTESVYHPDIDMAAMLALADDFTPDQTDSWRGAQIALGQNTIFNTPESLFERLPSYYPEYQLTIAGDIRLDNRAELFAKLGIAINRQAETGDARLVILAYLEWGEHAPEQLLGSFAFVIWDARAAKLFCCTDHFSSCGLYYFYDGRRFIFASTPDMICNASNVSAGINYNKLAGQVYPNTKYLFRNESWYKDIYPVPAASLLIVSEKGLQTRRYWQPEIKTPLLFKSEEDYAEAFREVIFRAVGDRLRSGFPVTALLSGGLDSSAVVAVAAKILEGQNRQLEVFSAILPDSDDPLLKDEKHYIDQFKSVPNVHIHYITAPDMGFMSGLEQLLQNTIEANLISRHYLNAAFLKKARELGARTILSGNGGELGATTYARGFYAELFLQLRWGRLWNEIRARSRVAGEPILRNIRSHLIKPLLPDFLGNGISAGKFDLRTAEVTFYQPGFIADSAGLFEGLKDQKKNLVKGLSPSHRKNQADAIRVIQSKSRGSYLPGEISFGHPLMDVRLLEFCLAAPIEFKIKNGYNRYLVRAGLDGILPSEIQWRTTKTPFSPDYYRRYNQQLPQVKKYLAAIAPGDPVRTIIDVEKLKAWSDIPVADNERNSLAARISCHYLPEAIYTIQFLRRFKEFER